MDTENQLGGQQLLMDALALMEKALELLDEAQAPPELGAHLDLATSRLRSLIFAQPKPLIKPGEGPCFGDTRA